MQAQNNSVVSLLIRPRYHYADSFDQMRARVVLAYATFSFFGSILVSLSIGLLAWASGSLSPVLLGAILLSILPAVLPMVLVHTGRLRLAALVTYVLFLALSAIGLREGIASSLLLILALPMIFGAFIWQGRGILFSFLIEGAMIVIVAILQFQQLLVPAQPFPMEQILTQTLLDLAVLVAIGFVSGAAAGELRQALRYAGNLVAQLRATSEVAQRTATFVDLNELLQQTVNYIRDRFAFYHVQVFLNDAEQRYANLLASTGEIGETLLRRGYRLAVGSPGIIGQAPLLREGIVRHTANDTEAQSSTRHNQRQRQTPPELP